MGMTCTELRELAPELALGITDGDDRAAALDHLATCEGCRRDVARLSGTVDALRPAAPAVEPPSGFEVRALAGFEPPASARPRRGRRALVLAAAVVVLLACLGLGATVLLDRDGGSSSQAASDRTAALTAPDGLRVGTVRVERTERGGSTGTSSLVVSVDPTAPHGTYRVQCDYESGPPHAAGTIDVGPDGVSRWSAAVTVPTYDLRRVRLVSATGDDNLEAEFA